MNHINLPLPKTIPFILFAFFCTLSSCYTTNSVLTHNPLPADKTTHEVCLSTTGPAPMIPQNIGINYHIASKDIGKNKIQWHGYSTLELPIRQFITEFELFGPSQTLKCIQLRLMVMPSFPVGDKTRIGFGLGFSGYHAFDKNGYYNENFGLINGHINYSHLVWKTNLKRKYENLSLSVSNKLSNQDAIETNQHSSNYNYLGPDLAGPFVLQSVTYSWVSEKELESWNATSVFKLNIGISLVGRGILHLIDYDPSAFPANLNFLYYDMVYVNVFGGFSYGYKF